MYGLLLLHYTMIYPFYDILYDILVTYTAFVIRYPYYDWLSYIISLIIIPAYIIAIIPAIVIPAFIIPAYIIVIIRQASLYIIHYVYVMFYVLA